MPGCDPYPFFFDIPALCSLSSLDRFFKSDVCLFYKPPFAAVESAIMPSSLLRPFLELFAHVFFCSSLQTGARVHLTRLIFALPAYVGLFYSPPDARLLCASDFSSSLFPPFNYRGTSLKADV